MQRRGIAMSSMNAGSGRPDIRDRVQSELSHGDTQHENIATSFTRPSSGAIGVTP